MPQLIVLVLGDGQRAKKASMVAIEAFRLDET
jgi:hypothetical protein